jgi:hypothetical protein
MLRLYTSGPAERFAGETDPPVSGATVELRKIDWPGNLAPALAGALTGKQSQITMTDMPAASSR